MQSSYGAAIAGPVELHLQLKRLPPNTAGPIEKEKGQECRQAMRATPIQKTNKPYFQSYYTWRTLLIDYGFHLHALRSTRPQM
jgi:hypothetical protein